MQSMTMGRKLVFGVGALVALLGVMSWASLNSISKLNDDFDVTVQKTVQKVILADGINQGRAEMQAAQRGFIMFIAAKDQGQAAALSQAFRDRAQSAARQLDEMATLLDEDRKSVV